MKVTATKCIDGKKHNWDTVWNWSRPGDYIDYRWCKKCGCRTEFIGPSPFKLRRCKEEDGSYYIEIPACHRVWEEKHGTN